MATQRSEYLDTLLADADEAAAVIANADAANRAALVAAARRESSLLAVTLDGSPLEPATARAVDDREARGLPPIDDLAHARLARANGSVDGGSAQSGGWARVLRLDAMPTQDVAAIEYGNMLRCFDAEPVIAQTFFEDPLPALRELHALASRDLVAAEVIGRLRQTTLAVHDGAQGRVVYHCADPAVIDGLLQELVTWLRATARGEHPLIVAGTVHQRLMQYQPFEAANGRVARAAARVVLRARGLDLAGIAVPERVFAADPLGYYSEVAATIRRRGELGPWLEFYAEAVVGSLADAAREIARPDVGTRARTMAEQWQPGETLTVAEYAERAGVARGAAIADLRALAKAGRVMVEPRSHGLLYRSR